MHRLDQSPKVREAEAGLDICRPDNAQDRLRPALLLLINRGVFRAGREGGREEREGLVDS